MLFKSKRSYELNRQNAFQGAAGGSQQPKMACLGHGSQNASFDIMHLTPSTAPFGRRHWNTTEGSSESLCRKNTRDSFECVQIAHSSPCSFALSSSSSTITPSCPSHPLATLATLATLRRPLLSSDADMKTACEIENDKRLGMNVNVINHDEEAREISEMMDLLALDSDNGVSEYD